MNVRSIGGVIQSKTNNSIWITANAGSGKTTFLTRRVVTLLLQGATAERICCITYTKAAASEMRARVLSLLRRLLLAEEAECVALVSELLGRAALPEDIAHARGLFGTVLDSPSGGLQLTTIHGFCQNILRRFPLEAEIAPHFTVLEDAAAEKLFNACKHRLLAYYNSSDPLLNAALELIGTRSSETRFDAYLNDIIQKRSQWETIWRLQSPELLRARLFALHGLSADANETALTMEYCGCVAQEEIAILRAHLPALHAHPNERERTVAPVLSAWLEVDLEGRPPLVASFKLLFLTKENELRASLLSKKYYPEGTALHGVMQRLGAVTLRYQQQLSALAAAEESFAVAVLARAMLALYAQAKMESQALDYDDLIGKTRELFANPEQLGWVMSKLDHRIDHLLIDEAQDTSREQWSVAQLLVEELIAASDGVGSGEVPRSLLVVGDEKQSIYSFQGAAPELFATKKSLFDALLTHSLSPLSHAKLTNSYRSAEAVLRLVDDVAQQPQIAVALSAGGVSEPHLLKRTDAEGLVTLYAPLIEPEKESIPALTMPLTYGTNKNAAQLLTEHVADTIQGWLARGRMLESEGRPLHAGDILILVKSRNPLVLPMIRALQKRKIAVAGIDRLTLSNHLAVRDILALMRWVMNVADDLSLAHVLRSPMIGLSDEELRALCVGRVGALWARIAEGEVRRTLTALLEQRTESPYDFLTMLLEVQGARRAFAMRFGEEVHEVLDELKAQAAAMPREMPPTLTYFYDWLAGSAREIKREMEGAGEHVRIMTVHGAKGLEAPVVLLIDTVNVPTTMHEKMFFVEGEANQLFPTLAISDEAKHAPVLVAAKDAKKEALLAEYYRLLYVALTRARDELHVWGSANKKGVVKAGSWYEAVEISMKHLGAVVEDEAVVLRDIRSSSSSYRGEVRRGPQKEIGIALSRPLPNPPPQGEGIPVWANASAPIITSDKTSISPSQLVAHQTISPYAQAGEQNARARGVRIHRVLELLEAESDAATITRLVQLVAPDWETGEQASVAAEIQALHNQERWIWEAPAHAEATICGVLTLDGHAIAVNGQIDRLIETPAEIIILDYKTGRQVPRDAGEISENYLLQLKTYQALVQQLSQGKPVRCAILWTAVPRLMWCDEAVAATPWPKQFVIQQTPLVA